MLGQAIKNLFEKKYFDICTLDRVLDVMDVRRDSEAYKLLYTLHCAHYDKMSKELRERLPYLVNEAIMPPDRECEAANIALRGYTGE